MSLVPEYILQTTINRGIKRMRSDSRLVGQLFRNLSVKDFDQMNQFIKKQPIDLCMNYPRDAPLRVPAFVILLKNYREAEAFLGDSMGLEIPDEFAFDGPTDPNEVAGVGSTSFIGHNVQQIWPTTDVVSATANTVKMASPKWFMDQFLDNPSVVRIVAGKGVGQTRNIIGNSRTVLMVDQNWLTIPDSTSVFDIIAQPTEVFGEPVTLYDRQNPPLALERKGSIYDLSYQIQVIGQTQELTNYLAIVLKAIFTLERIPMEVQGVMNMKLSASDLVPRPEYQPDFSYMRSMTIDFQFHFDTFDSIAGVGTSFRLVLEGEPADPLADSFSIYSDTSWSYDSKGNLVDSTKGFQRVYFGSGLSATLSGSSLPMALSTPLGGDIWTQAIQSLAEFGTLITNKRQQVINYFTNPGQIMFYILPTRFGATASSFTNTATGMIVPFVLVEQETITTPFGTELFDVWQSVSEGVGFLSVTIV